MHNPNYNLTHKERSIHWDHVAAVAKQEDSLLKSKHIFIDSKSKMKVKFAREVLSESTAQAMEESHFPYSKDETSFTREYIRMCDRLFRTMNSVSLHSNYMQELLSVLLFFKRWHDEIQEKLKSCSSREEKKAVRKQFIPLKTYNDLLVLIRGTIGLIGCVNINFPHINIVPKSLCQDDIENYFSLVRGREVSPTVQRYMEIRKTLDIDFSITQELDLLEGSSSSYEGPAFSPKPLNLSKNQSTKGKTEERANTMHTLRQMLQQSQANCEHILAGEKCSALFNYSEDQKKKLECQFLEILSIIELYLPTTLIKSTHLVLDSLSDPGNRHHVMIFNILLDQKLKSKYFNLHSFNKDSYNTAWTQLLHDTDLFCWWSSLCNLICGGSKATEEAMELYLRKFVKRRCVHHLMKEDLSPVSGHTAAIRAKLTKTSHKSKSMKEPAPTDVCKRCNLLGHWAKNCKNSPDPQWLAKQVCFKCGLTGHLAAQCINSSKPRCKQSKGNTKWLNLPALVGLLQSNDLEKNPKYQSLKDHPPSGIADIRPYLRQRSEAWKEARKNILNASKAGVITGHFGLSQAQNYWKSAVQGEIMDNNHNTNFINKLAMEWGTVCEDCARVSSLKFLADSCYEYTVFETGLWTVKYKVTGMFGRSPDDIVVIKGTGMHGITGRGIVEYKCPFKGGFPSHYKQLPACYYMQMQLNMKATNTHWCHFVTWTPQTTRIYIVQRNDAFIDELLEAVNQHFWTLTAAPTSLHPKLKEMERKAKDHSEKIEMVIEIQSLSSLSSLPHLSNFSPDNIDTQIAKEKSHKSQKTEKQNKRILHCSKCRRPLVICNQDKCIEKKNSAAKRSLFRENIAETQLKSSEQPQVSLTFNSYINGSGNVANSCHQDAFLIVMLEILHRNPQFITGSTTCTQHTNALQALKSPWTLYCNHKYHDSKMALWLWLQNKTCNGRIYYRLGNQCSLEGIIHSLHHYMSEEERKFFSFVTSVSRRCSRFSDHKFKAREQHNGTFKIIVDEIIPEDRADPSDPQSSYSLVKYFNRYAIPGGHSCLSGTCDYKYQVGSDDSAPNIQAHKCNKPALRTTTIKQIPNLIILEIFKPDALPLKWDPYVDQEFDVFQGKYKLTGLIYHSQARAHYWSELYVGNNNTHSVSTGWYTHDGLANGGMCLKTGTKPKLESHGRHLSLVFFERVRAACNTETPTHITPDSKSARTWTQTESSPSGITPARKKRL